MKRLPLFLTPILYLVSVSVATSELSANVFEPLWNSKDLKLSPPLKQKLENQSANSATYSGPHYRYDINFESDRALQLIVSHRQSGNLVFSTIPGKAFVGSGIYDLKMHENKGSFTYKDKRKANCFVQTIDALDWQDNQLIIEGKLGKAWQPCHSDYRLVFAASNIDSKRLEFSLTLMSERLQENDDSRSFLRFASHAKETFKGFGMQFSYIDMKGRALPIYTQEQGIGRGLQPLSIGAELTNGKGVAGKWYSSYASVPQFISNQNRGFFLKNSEISYFDMKKSDSFEVKVNSTSVSGEWITASSEKEAIEVYTHYSGRMKPLPEWADRGVILGFQGRHASATETAYEVMNAAEEIEISVSAFWLQDWVGKRTTSFGSQLWWSWSLDEQHYPGWDQMVAAANQSGIKILSYINPFLTDISEKEGDQFNYFADADNLGLFVKNAENQTYLIENTSFSAGLLDLTNPQAREYAKKIIKDELISSGVHGWMADFGEALPMESRLTNGEALSYHNHYPVEWAKVNREVIAEAGLDDDMLFFTRSGFTQSPKYSRLFWLGDQLVSWDGKDGIKTALYGLISSGYSGFSLNHSDIGGYTTITSPPVATFHRSKELFMRWAELNTFTTLMRTHEGNQPENNHQFYTDKETFSHLKAMTEIFVKLRPYRRELMDIAYEKGLPLVRSMALEFPADATCENLVDQFMLGEHLLVAPVLDAGQSSVKVYLPRPMRYYWNGEEFSMGWHDVPAPIGKPAFFITSDAPSSLSTVSPGG